MQYFWEVIAVIVLVIVIYAYIESKLSERKKRKLRETTIPEITSSLATGIPYNVFLSDGRSFDNVKILGSVDGDDEQYSFAGWEGMLVLKKENEKRVFLKKSSIRFVEEI